MSDATPVLNANDSDFQNVVLSSELPCVVDFWAKWCGPCKMLTPIVEAAANRWEGKAQFVKVDVDTSPNTAAKYNVRSIPTLVVFKGGEAIATKVGLLKNDEIDALVNDALGS